MKEFETPESRNEAILQNILGADNDLLPPQSRIETLLQMLLNELHGGGSTGVVVDDDLSTTSTNPLENKVITANLEALFNAEAAIKTQLFGEIAGLPINNRGSMELYAKDLDTIVTSGFYNAMECTNAAYPYMAMVVIGYYLTGYCVQIGFDVTTGNAKKRTQINGTWEEWTDL